MSRAKLAEEIKKLLPEEKNKRIRQAIMKAYGGATSVAVGVRDTISQENRLQNGILVEGTVAITTPTSASLSGWAWVIDFAIQEGADQTITITAPDATFPRIDYFHGDDAGLIHYAAGILDGAGNSIFPTIPAGNIILKKVLRNTDGSNDDQPVEPINSDFVSYVVPQARTEAQKKTARNNIGLDDDYIPSTGTILFDRPRKYGYNGTPVTGNLTIGITDAKEINMAKVLHDDTVPPTISVPGGVTLHLSGGTYDVAKVNEYLFICHKNNAGAVTRISYTVSPNLL
jgi:hypothetical protein